jgi:hypothetical protein
MVRTPASPSAFRGHVEMTAGTGRHHALKWRRWRVGSPATGVVNGQEWARSGQESVSSSALASWRSAVPKPSVNQP